MVGAFNKQGDVCSGKKHAQLQCMDLKCIFIHVQ